MTEHDIPVGTAPGDLPPSATAGALLARAREAAGLSVDAVAQQLKLAPRQVRALEEGDYTHLPGRTFVRGFVRNYARLLHLDPENVVGALATGPTASELAAPTLHPTAPTIGELPTSDHARPGWARWAIPVTLAAIVAAAAVYEWWRPAGDARAPGGGSESSTAAPPASSPGAQDRSAVSLANPLASGAAAPDGAAVQAPVTATAQVPSAAAVPAPATAQSPSPAAPANQPTVAAPVAEQPLTIAFRDYSWTEVRDRDGRVLLSGMNPGGTAQSVSGAPPLELVIGNAADVTLTYRGQPVDLVPYTRQNVARLTLP